MFKKMIFITVFFVAFPVPASAFDQLGCQTSSECFIECCPDGAVTCQQPCRNTCGNRPSACPGFYLFCKYNTFASEWNWLELSSQNRETMRGVFQIYASDGTPVGSESRFEVNALARGDFDIHSLVGKNRYGQIVVSLYGAIDGLSASVSHYRVGAQTAEQTAAILCDKQLRRVQE